MSSGVREGGCVRRSPITDTMCWVIFMLWVGAAFAVALEDAEGRGWVRESAGRGGGGDRLGGERRAADADLTYDAGDPELIIVVIGHQMLMWVLFATYDPDHVHPTMLPLSGLGAVTLAVHAFFYNLAPSGGDGGGGAEEGGARDLKKDL